MIDKEESFKKKVDEAYEVFTKLERLVIEKAGEENTEQVIRALFSIKNLDIQKLSTSPELVESEIKKLNESKTNESKTN